MEEGRAAAQSKLGSDPARSGNSTAMSGRNRT
jgi:hypothetical protein